MTQTDIPRPPTPALDTWRKFRGDDPERRKEYDALWRAACWEAAALDWWRAGQLQSCLDCLATAQTIAHEELEHLEGLDLP